VTAPNHQPPESQMPLARVSLMRRMFWENVVREMLTGLSMIRGTQPELFDGRIALLTHGGERIPIADVSPMFACGIPGTPAEKAASIAVECTVFRIRTPGGEVFTFPLSEIRGLHALSPELMKEMEREAGDQSGEPGDGSTKPFGFAAFRSIADTGNTTPGAVEQDGAD
jgi:hypothetical protein